MTRLIKILFVLYDSHTVDKQLCVPICIRKFALIALLLLRGCMARY